MNKNLLLFLLIIVSACSETSKSVTVIPPVVDEPFVPTYSFSELANNITSFEASKIVGQLNDPKFTEASGIAASEVNNGMFYIEEDSGNPNQIQLINQSGELAGVYTISGVANRDWEDIAVAPGPMAGVSYVYVAEIGDNKNQYPTKFVYRFPEPSLAGNAVSVNETITSFDKIELKLPDGIKNAESLLIDPLTKDIYLVSKESAATIYVAPYPQDLTKINTMKKVAVLPLSTLTAGDISPDGNEVLVKSKSFICYWKKSSNESIIELFKKTPTLVPYTIEQQGEAVCFASDGSGYYTTSERPDATVNQPLYFYRRK